MKRYTKEEILKIMSTIDLSRVDIISPYRESTRHNKQEMNALNQQHPDLFSAVSEMKYWRMHLRDADFIDKMFCGCGFAYRNSWDKNSASYRKYCSPRCARVLNAEKINKTMIERYGSLCPLKNKEINQKGIQTNLKKYGVKNAGQAKEVQEKMQKTCLKKYGVEYIGKSPEVQDKIKATILNRYGVNHPAQAKEVQEKMQKTCLKKYGVEYITQRKIQHKSQLTKEYLEKNFVDEHGFFQIEKACEYYQVCLSCMQKYKYAFHIFQPCKKHLHKTQKEIYDFILCNSKGSSLLFNSRTVIDPLELDIFIPSKNIAIEYNGLMWHSFGESKYSIFNNSEYEKLNKNAHLNKTCISEQHNIHLFHIFENEWLDENKQKIWKSMLLNSLGMSERIYARKCIIKEVPFKEVQDFLEKNHIQGVCVSSINLGLYYQEELVSLMTFGKPRFNKNYEWELLRFCNRTNTSVVGGASKLFKNFVKQVKPKSIISYANRRWSQGNLYEKLGFRKINETAPSYFYFLEKDFVLYNRMKFQKCKLKEKLEHFDPSLSETQNMYNNGYRKIYDCGNLVYGLSLC